MDRRIVLLAPQEYVVYNSLDRDESNLEHKLSFHRLCTLLRKYDDVDGYIVEYWNKLFEYFCQHGDVNAKFSSIEDVKDALTIEACAKRLEKLNG